MKILEVVPLSSAILEKPDTAVTCNVLVLQLQKDFEDINRVQFVITDICIQE